MLLSLLILAAVVVYVWRQRKAQGGRPSVAPGVAPVLPPSLIETLKSLEDDAPPDLEAVVQSLRSAVAAIQAPLADPTPTPVARETPASRAPGPGPMATSAPAKPRAPVARPARAVASGAQSAHQAGYLLDTDPGAHRRTAAMMRMMSGPGVCTPRPPES